MAAPKIKLYRLSRDFTTDSLNKDKKTETNDELLPVFDKYVSPDDIMAKRPAVGVHTVSPAGRHVHRQPEVQKIY